MTPKHSNSSPAVSQLAGEISRMMRIRIHNLSGKGLEVHSPDNKSNKEWLDRMEKEDAPAIAKLISAALSEREEKVGDLIQAAHEAKLQIEYLHEKFKHTGSGNAVLTRLEVALAALGE